MVKALSLSPSWIRLPLPPAVAALKANKETDNRAVAKTWLKNQRRSQEQFDLRRLLDEGAEAIEKEIEE